MVITSNLLPLPPLGVLPPPGMAGEPVYGVRDDWKSLPNMGFIDAKLRDKIWKVEATLRGGYARVTGVSNSSCELPEL